jgi:undecaprenyl diphosphate synthase
VPHTLSNSPPHAAAPHACPNALAELGLPQERVPRHIAIIMDGNGRWATQRGLPRLVGHRKGAERVKEIVRCAPDLGIRWLTIYAFSTENWKRSTEEVLGLMAIFARYIQREADRLAAEGVRMRFIGDRTRLDPKLQRLM